jgi:putative membrane protein
MQIKNGTELRDRLAVERTHLANERTLLAYMRTALGVAVTGAGLLKFFTENAFMSGLGWLFVAAGVGLSVVGARRFLAVRRELIWERRST